jgi:hypothetical protein
MSVNPQINRLVDFLHGKEGHQSDIGAVARFIAEHAHDRPAIGRQSRWPDVDALKTHTNWYGPKCTHAQIDAALAESERAAAEAATNVTEV